ncbi:sterol desaturase family protein [Paraflavitalea soli]|uniref:Sterol desaturase family protein n=1 Tax=Paraflavitalea soli TaxID=2315862 RepID=A0A3B7MH38_9BACT|nr:sterol desaturase family protein [Paraflavitalea soli]AXY72633.1 sterol desaturase family protein [Paraflavitalea soli]
MAGISYKAWAAGLLLLLIIAEMIWSWRHDKKVYQVKETLTNLGIMAGFQLSKFLFAGMQLSILGWVYRYRVFDFEPGILLFLVTFVVTDLIYYWFHRASHVWKPLWAFHLVHHSSLWMNLTTSYRLNWFTAIVTPFFYVPVALLGFPPLMIALSVGLNLLYQFFMHTEAVGKLGPLEGIIDTPSAHRVHHGANPLYIDKNFGGVFMIWDRLFGTYQPETEKVRYGITTGFVSHNPFVLIFHGFIDLFKGKMKYKG